MIRIALTAALVAASVLPASARGYDRGGSILGGLIGGFIGGMMAPRYYPPQPYYQQDDGGMQYCMRRFRSYNPETGYYLGYDGRYHPCP